MKIHTKNTFPLLSSLVLFIAGCSTGLQAVRQGGHFDQPVSNRHPEELLTNIEENQSEIDAVLNDRSRWIDGPYREF